MINETRNMDNTLAVYMYVLECMSEANHEFLQSCICPEQC